MNLSFITNMGSRRTGFISIIISAAFVYNLSDQDSVLVLIDPSIAEDSMVEISKFINSTIQEKASLIDLISLTNLLQVFDNLICDKFINECLFNPNEFTKALERVKLKFIHPMDNVITEVAKSLSGIENVKLIVLTNLTHSIKGEKLSRFISKYALITSLVHNSGILTLIFDSVLSLGIDKTKRVIGVLASRSKAYIIKNN